MVVRNPKELNIYVERSEMKVEVYWKREHTDTQV